MEDVSRDVSRDESRDESAADAADADALRSLPPLPEPNRWEQRSEACCGSSLVCLEEKTERRQTKTDRKQTENG